ncbi:MAG: NAD-dependent epimerase/dehydratase family protein [Phototrophicaceae bacterium]
MKILVIGGTRFYGRAFTELAVQHGHDVTIFHRGQSDSEHFEGVTRIIGDRNTDLEKLGDGTWDAVLDTCGFTPDAVTQAAEYLKDKVKHYVFVSSISVYQESTDINRDEDAALLEHPDGEPTDELKMENYGSLKVLCEYAAEAVFGDHVTQIRPGLIVGPHDASNRFTYWQTRVAKGGDMLVPGDGSRIVQVIDARDLAAFTLTVIENQTMGIFHVTGPQEPLSLHTILNTAKDVTGSDVNFVHIDEDWLLEKEVGPWMELPLWLPTEAGQAMMNVDIQRALDAGLTLRPIEETIRDTLAWYNEINGDEKEWAAGMKPEREAELLEAWANQ